MSVLSRISTANDERSARLAGIGLMLLSIAMFSFGDALGKFLDRGLGIGLRVGGLGMGEVLQRQLAPGRLGRPLAQRFRERHLGIGRADPRALEILLIRHCFRRPAVVLIRSMPRAAIWFRPGYPQLQGDLGRHRPEGES